MAADRLQALIIQCLHKNQYGFTKNRTIHDCVAWAFEYIYQCKSTGAPCIILKLDFEKAFDTIEHEALLHILRYKGFNEPWLRWVKDFLSSCSSSILLNGVPGKQFKCKRGVRQGDPLSPLLCVLGGDVLQSVVNDLFHNSLLQLPIITGDAKFSILQYVDDTLLILKADRVVLKDALNNFSKSTGMYVNYHKSYLLPINISDDQATSLAQAFGCNVQGMRFTYLGLPLGTTRPKIQDLMPLVDRLERRLVVTSTFLAYGGRLQLIRSCLSSMPIFFLCSLDIPPGIIKQLNRLLDIASGVTGNLIQKGNILQPGI
jgi:hypothetical protein